MKTIFTVLAILIAAPASADAIDTILDSRCSGVLNMDARLLSDGAREAYLAMMATWILVSNQMKNQPPLEEVCREKPTLSLRLAIEEAMRRTAN